MGISPFRPGNTLSALQVIFLQLLRRLSCDTAVTCSETVSPYLIHNINWIHNTQASLLRCGPYTRFMCTINPPTAMHPDFNVIIPLYVINYIIKQKSSDLYIAVSHFSFNMAFWSRSDYLASSMSSLVCTTSATSLLLCLFNEQTRSEYVECNLVIGALSTSSIVQLIKPPGEKRPFQTCGSHILQAFISTHYW